MKKTYIRTFLAILLCVALLPMASALALKASGNGTVRRGNFEDSGIIFKVPNSFTLETVDAGKTADVIKLTGPKDVNGFIPRITVKIEAEIHDINNVPLKQTLEYVELDLKGSSPLCLVDELPNEDNGNVLRRVIFYNNEEGRMVILCLYLMNVGGYGVTFEYQTFTATRSLPDEVPQLPDLVKSITIQ